MKKTKREMKIGIGIAVILVTAILGFIAARQIFVKDKSSVGQAPIIPQARRVFDGMLVEKGKEHVPIVGVMIENMIEAQPLSGIADAALVFEALAEANITRFLAYFVLDENAPKDSPSAEELSFGAPSIEIGPVRSARPYYLDFASEFNTLYAHVGSSPAAYEMLRKIKDSPSAEGLSLVDLDQWYNSQYFERVKDKFAPHNVYTSLQSLKKAYGTVMPPNQEYLAWQFKNDAPPDLRGDVKDIKVGYVAPYNVEWLYDKFENKYKRMQWARPNFSDGKVSVGYTGAHVDANGKPIIAKNIAVAFMEMKVLDEIGRKEFKTIGQGKGLVFQDGRVMVGTWKKPSARERIRWYDAQENEVAFNAGTTWVEIVPIGYDVKY